MNKQTLIAVVVIILLAVGAGIFFTIGKPNPQKNQVRNSQSTAMEEKSENTMMKQTTSLKALMEKNANQTCTVKDVQAGSEGTIFTANGRMRGDFTVTTDGKTTASHMIADSEYAYIWMDELQTGMKVSLAAMEDVNEKALTNAPKTVNFDRDVDYSCTPWKVNESVFEPPKDMNFTDMSAMMKQSASMEVTASPNSTNSGLPDKEAACSACEQVPPDLRAQCRAALSCGN